MPWLVRYENDETRTLTTSTEAAMSKAVKRRLQAVTTWEDRSLYAVAPWTARHQNDCSEIDVYAEAAGNWITLTEIHDTAFVDAERTSNFIVRAVNAYDANRALIGELAGMLRRCLASGRFDVKVEDSAELLIRKVEAMF